MFKWLLTNCQERKPEHESQVRPLVGLTPPQAKAAWEHAVAKAQGRKVTARTVKSAVRELQLQGSPSSRSMRASPASKRQLRTLIDSTISELLALVGQKASHDKLTPKLEALHQHVQTLFAH